MEKLREEILKKVKSFYSVNFRGNKFIPGKTYIPLYRKLFDQEELVNLVDASLDFQLTAGRRLNKW